MELSASINGFIIVVILLSLSACCCRVVQSPTHL